MTVWNFSPPVLKNKQLKYFSMQEEELFISYIYFIFNHRNSDLFACKYNIFFSHVKISCFHAQGTSLLFML